MTSLSSIRAAVAAPISVADLKPPPRFSTVSFESFRIDAAVAGQAEAVELIRRFAAHPPGMLARWLARWQGSGGARALYLDGGFGVGKTHLLASAFHVARGSRRYLSFAEAMSLMTVHGHRQAIELLAAGLVCIDEFELDDPTNTRLADVLVSGLLARGSRIITTSNTVPGELGQGRMAVDLFRTQLARIEAAFSDVHVPGADFRRRHLEQCQDPSGWGPAVEPLSGDRQVVAEGAELDRWLRELPVIQLRQVAAAMTGLSLTSLMPFHDQLAALRFVHLIDKLYDHGVALRVRTTTPISELFPPEHCLAAFAKKYRRCQSRLSELAV